jgi:hypothetical protein
MKTVTLSNGKKLTVQSINPLLMQKINDSTGDKPMPPTYESPTAGGDVEINYHDETTVSTPEEKEAWREYQERLAFYNAERNKRFMRAFFSRGVVLNLDAAAMERWAREMKYLGVDVPEGDEDDPEIYIERQVLYVETELIGHPNDMILIMKEVMTLSGIDEAEVAAATRLFRGEVEGATDSSGDVG